MKNIDYIDYSENKVHILSLSTIQRLNTQGKVVWSNSCNTYEMLVCLATLGYMF